MTRKTKHHPTNIEEQSTIEQPTDASAPEPVLPTEPAAGPTPQSEPSEGEPKKPEAYSAEELTDHLQRLAAEFENYKKRIAKEMQGMRESGMAQAIESILPVLDSFDQSLASPTDTTQARIWRDGLEKISRQLRDALEKLGLCAIRPQKGEALDPNLHEVLMALPTAEVDAGGIVSTWVVGYKFKNRLLRPAKVQVAVAPPAPNPEEEGGPA
jgi:molecular chaperone GrpE